VSLRTHFLPLWDPGQSHFLFTFVKHFLIALRKSDRQDNSSAWVREKKSSIDTLFKEAKIQVTQHEQMREDQSAISPTRISKTAKSKIIFLNEAGVEPSIVAAERDILVLQGLENIESVFVRGDRQAKNPHARDF
jgi:hypothetical protein